MRKGRWPRSRSQMPTENTRGRLVLEDTYKV
jgi:hypothetical protein